MVVMEHRKQYGDWCPGWGVPAHEAHDLTADHVVPYAVSGDTHGPLGVLCRSCNGRKAHSTELPSPIPSTTSRSWFS